MSKFKKLIFNLSKFSMETSVERSFNQWLERLGSQGSYVYMNS
jgi:hypothetical protein